MGYCCCFVFQNVYLVLLTPGVILPPAEGKKKSCCCSVLSSSLVFFIIIILLLIKKTCDFGSTGVFSATMNYYFHYFQFFIIFLIQFYKLNSSFGWAKQDKPTIIKDKESRSFQNSQPKLWKEFASKHVCQDPL